MSDEIVYTRTDAITNKVNKVSELINNLNITTEENNELIEALTDLQCVTEREMFLQGMTMVLNYIEGEATNKTKN